MLTHLPRQRQDYLAHVEEDDVHISLTSDEEQSAFLSRLNDLDAIKAVIPLAVGGTPTDDEKELYDILKNLQNNDSTSLDALDGERPPSVEVVATDAEPSADEAPAHDADYPTVGAPDLHVSPPLIIIAVSCIAAFLSMLCIGAGIYALTHLRSFMLKSDLAWDILPRLERRVGLDGPDDLSVGGGDGGDRTPRPGKPRLLTGDTLLPALILDEKLNEKTGGSSDIDSESAVDPDEKFEDAPEHSLLFLDPDLPPAYDDEAKPTLPQIVIDDIHADPDLLPLPDHARPTPFATPLASPASVPIQMRELPSSPSSKPLWSLRAADAPALGLSGSGSPTRAPSPGPQLPGALFSDEEMMVEISRPQPQSRPRPRQPLDIAFALQLRPGLGLGADSAWLVRFLMTMFGWMTVLIGGSGGESGEATRRALTA
ncbi:hypothetical protein TRAPUB_7446 [Trametes pubescens]|uniref:Uncharacterized protein n=1 Tax=Trametes pubescens TaxID=154538 RepID=A0A1M2V3A0_TRAPU|nr:hypothetical protein TRAPUB_7446 [Trametes pubescens]